MTDERHERVSRLLGEHGPQAPPALRRRIEAQAADRAERRLWGWELPRLARFALGATVALVALALVLPLVFEGSGEGEPTVLDAHAILGEGPAAPAPGPLTGHPQLLAADFEGLRFPNWEQEFGWKAFGRRSDELDGRRAETVFYEHEEHEIAYTIVDGKPLAPPPGARHRTVDGVDLALYRAPDGHEIVSFQRQGKTCVLSGHVEHRSTMVKLATWHADGSLVF
jgi:hypothetical protein